MIVESAFLFWPVHLIGVSMNWAYGIYAPLHGLEHRELMQTGRVRSGRRKRGGIPSFTEEQVNDSFLRHEDLRVALDANHVLFETYQLDAQRYVWPRALVREEVAKEAFEQFLNLEPQRPEVAVRFLTEFGEFDHLELQGNRFVGRGIPAEIQQFCRESIQQGRDPFAMSLGDFWSVRQDIVGLLNLASALSKPNITDIRRLCIRRRTKSAFHEAANWLAVGRAILCTDLSASLNPGHCNPRLVLAERDGKLVALTMGTTVRTSLYLTLLDKIVSKTEFKTCPNCRRYFMIAGSRDKQFCTDVCRNAAKVRRWRDRHKKEGKPRHAGASTPTRR